ncbi:restriction endonuclease subunit S [Microbacterium sp.]|uniref:restriction endonuclease subunit S n=1 Tax=Microbacterium sp. TaxID=51671 RepID=UPI0019B79113|nr:restriction endonuclease subunit S [Microbacterium sp.]MBD3756800.1 restriction endonuclease subunit S [Microbacterium sp.]
MQWSTVPLSEVIELQRGHDLPSDERREGTVPIIGSFGVTGFHDTARYRGPGVGIGRSGASIGAATFVREDYWPLNTCLFVKDFKGNDPRWIYRLLDQIDFAAYNSGSAQPSLNRNFLRSIPVKLPPIFEQQAIAEVLGALDDKIAANTALVATADALLATEFRTRLHQTEVHDRELTAIANVVLGGTPPRARPDYWTDGTIPWLNSGAVNATRIVEPSELITAEALANSAAKLMPNGATLLAITGATLGQIARLEMTASGNQSIVGVWSDDVNVNTWLYFAIQARLDDLLARATGAAQQHVSKGDVEQLAVPVPSQAVLEEFSSVATPLLELAATAERENRTLAATRDALLPQLMSGKLRVRDAERVASEVGA